MERQEIVPAEPAGQVVPIDAGKVIEIKNLMVSPLPRLDVALGTSESFVKMAEKMGPSIRAIVWNEGRMCLLTDDRNTTITFEPEFRPEAAMFFERDQRGERREDGSILRVWEGDYAPVKFTKRDLLAFIDRYNAVIDGADELKAAVKKMNVKQITAEHAEMLDTDSDNVRTTTEEILTTNVPKLFKMRMGIAENLVGELHFKVEVVKEQDRYERDKGYKLILRCINARQVMQGVMGAILAKLPADIPKYYGAMRIGSGKKDGW